MKIVIFGLTITSSWGNGHATLWRGLCRALAAAGHRVVFYERDVPYYADNRDCLGLAGMELVLYPEWDAIEQRARAAIADADAVVVTSYCPDALVAADRARNADALSVFYDLDTPVTLARVARGEPVGYLGPDGLRGFDLVLSYTGGRAIELLRQRLGAGLVVPLYGHVDPEVHQPAMFEPRYVSDLSYLGTFAIDRQAALTRFFVEPAAQRPDRRFLIGGAQYPANFPWSDNIYFVRHLPPSEHPAFFSSSRLTLNVTRSDMAALGWCPSGRLFEAAACGTAILTDRWDGVEQFFAPEREIVLLDSGDDVLAAIDMEDAEVIRLGRAARERVLAEHTSAYRAVDFVAALELARHPPQALAATGS